MLVACSGGPDSVALAHALARLAPEWGLDLTVASVDHGLRPGSADEVATVGELAAELGAPFHRLQVVVPAGPSVQGAARAARYGALAGLVRSLGATALATGHTLDDQAETVLSRILRGAGITGLSGIAPRRRDGVIRPLIDCSRRQVRDHLTRHGLGCVEDPSNADGRFERVRLRTDLLPRLATEDPQVARHLAQLADEARATSRWARRRAERMLAHGTEPHRLSSARLRAAPETVRRAALRRWIVRGTGVAPGRAHLEQIERALGGRGEVWLPGGYRVLAEPGQLLLRR